MSFSPEGIDEEVKLENDDGDQEVETESRPKIVSDVGEIESKT